MEYYVPEGSIVRKIWGTGDVVLFIFGGAAAEFALNKAVDWLYFTNRLPSDPLNRLFSTVAYASDIVFAEKQKAEATIDKIRGIHTGVEKARGQQIPDWAYRDVLYMLIDYSIRAYACIKRPLTQAEKEEVYTVFWRMGVRMQISDLPIDHASWLLDRKRALETNLVNGPFTKDLFVQYKKHLGGFRYTLLLMVQAVLVPEKIKTLLQLRKNPLTLPLLSVYRFSKYIGLGNQLKRSILPSAFREQIMALDRC